MKGILPLITNGSGCDYHRMILPLKYMGVDFDYYKSKKVSDVIDETKIIMFNRTPHGQLDLILNLRKKHGFKIVMDLDDYWILHPKHYMLRTWTVNKIGEQIQKGLEYADVVICTTSILADKIKSINKNVHIIPNALPFGHEQFTDVKETACFNENGKREIRFIYAGGGSHFWDLKTLNIPFIKVNNNPQLQNAKFILAGFNDANKDSLETWSKIENVFNLNGKLKNYRREYTLDLEKYMDHYKYADVSLIPIENNNFNRFKSNLKIVEAGCKYLPVICSDSEPYSNELNKNLIMYANNASSWYEHIKYCTLNPSFVEDRGKDLGEYVRTHYNLFKANEYRKQLFENLIN